MSAKPPSVAVLVSAGRHPVSGTPRSCRGDAVAMALGRKLAGDAARIVHAGEPNGLALKDYLAYGAGHIEVLNVSQRDDALLAIAQHVKSADLILTGTRVEQGEGSGLLPYLLANALNRPVIADVLDVQIEKGEVRVRQFLPKGKRRLIAAPLPLVLAVHPLAPAELTYAHARQIAGRIETITTMLSAAGAKTTAWTIEPAARRANPLKAPENRDGHARMVSYVESQAKGGAVAFEGSPVDKAQILLSYLRENRLVDF
jgi:electron transfer flavoprotein beta subunit